MMELSFKHCTLVELDDIEKQFVVNALYNYRIFNNRYLSAQLDKEAVDDTNDAKRWLSKPLTESWVNITSLYPDANVIVARSESTVVGTLVYTIGNYQCDSYPLIDTKDPVAHVACLWVTEDVRKQKVGSAIWEYFINTLGSMNIRYWQSTVNDFNHAGINFSKRICRCKFLENWYTHKRIFGRHEFQGPMYAGFQLNSNKSLQSIIVNRLATNFNSFDKFYALMPTHMTGKEYAHRYVNYLTNSTSTIFVIDKDSIVIASCVGTSSYIELTPIVDVDIWRTNKRHLFENICTTASKLSPRITRSVLVYPIHDLMINIEAAGLGCYARRIGGKL